MFRLEYFQYPSAIFRKIHSRLKEIKHRIHTSYADKITNLLIDTVVSINSVLRQ